MPRHGITLRWRPGTEHRRYRVKHAPLWTPAIWRRLLDWGVKHGRSFPWRAPDLDPFGRLVAEMLLRQTAAHQVTPVWERLMERFPTVQALAAADPVAVRNLVAPLGLASQRTTALQSAAQHLVERCGGQVPAGEPELLEIPHVGPYTASAVRCFGFGIAAPIVDVNILRIFDRYFGLKTRTHNPHRERPIWQRAAWLLPDQDGARYQYALLDLAALICRPKKPLCGKCPVREGCRSNVYEGRPR